MQTNFKVFIEFVTMLFLFSVFVFGCKACVFLPGDFHGQGSLANCMHGVRHY